MGAPAPAIPQRFPCWCKAVYSWGGESKRDLGFIEGDLIECLNAGDGSWWMGRLRRDRRMVGLFPSNFVKVLDESFQPAPISRNASPLTSQNQVAASPQKQKSVFRKPFQGYKEFGYRDNGCNTAGSTPEQDKPKKQKFSPYSSMKTASAPGSLRKPAGSSPLKEQSTPFRIPSPPPRHSQRSHRRAPSPVDTITARSVSPAPPNMYRASSPAPSQMYRAASPAPSQMYRATSPAPSQMYRAASPAPPHMYRAASPAPSQYRPVSPRPQSMYRAASPAPSQYRPVSPRPDYYGHPHHHTPQPIRNDAYSSQYQDRSGYQQSRAPSPAPSAHFNPVSRGPSPAPMALASSSPPPAPPPHRVAYNANRAPSPAPYETPGEYNTPGGNSANAQSTGMTPSPLRDAMNDIMTSLNDMSSVAGRSSPPRPETPVNAWSPEAFNMHHTMSAQNMRPQSAMDMHSRQDGWAQPRNGYDDQDSNPSVPPSRDGPPELGNYVQRMEHRLRHTQSSGQALSAQFDRPDYAVQAPQYGSRPTTASSRSESEHDLRLSAQTPKSVSPRKSAYELGRPALQRTYTTKTSVTSSSSGAQSAVTTSTNTSTSTALTSHSLMSGHSAGAFSATSAGSLARRKFGMGSLRGRRPLSVINSKSHGDIRGAYERDGEENQRPQSPVSGISYHSSHATQPAQTPTADWTSNPFENAGVLGGLSAPKAKKSGFFRKMIDTAKTTAKTGAANARSTIGSASGSRPPSRVGSPTKKSMLPDGITAIEGGTSSNPTFSSNAVHRDMGMGGGNDWMQVRRDVNRSNSLSRNERTERAERCQMLDLSSLNPIDELLEQTEGDEGLDGLAITEPTDFNTINLALVDKGTRFVTGMPQTVTATTLAQSYLCRPYRSDVQRLRAIFTWVAERITWEEDFEGQIDPRRVLQTKRGCSEEIAVLVRDLCSAVGLHAEVVRGYLKGPGETLDLDSIAQSNHYWNAVIVDGEWRIMDCSLASPTNPRRSAYSLANNNVAESWWFLTRPMESCYTHVPLLPEQQHIVPPVPHEVLMALPCACPPYFRHLLELVNFDTSVLHLENLDMAHIQIAVPEDVECVAEVEARAFARDWDGDQYESGDFVRKSALAQAEWVGGRKHYTIKALLPGDEGQGVLKIYAGKRGLMHSIKDNPHALAFAVPLFHTGQNPPYTFFTRHPTPHAQRHDLYVAQPQCARLVINNTFVFCVRQHPSSLSRFSPDTWGGSNSNLANNSGRSGSSLGMRPTSPNPYARPGSAMSMVSAAASVSQSGSGYSDGSTSGAGPGALTDKQQKPAKLAVQSPSGKIIRLTRKQDYAGRNGVADDEAEGLGSTWETVVKVGERGIWRGLVLADRSARWCVFAEWDCV
ncbi:hypothetical protein MBLNU459_g3396t1 [Dothideomycetes sp. NU459]